jgi:hypothetical protein
MPGPFERDVTLEEWITSANADPDHGGPLTMLRASHMRYGEGGAADLGEEIAGRRYEPGRGWSPKEEAELFLKKANTYAQGLPGIQRFKIQAYYNNSPEPSASFHFTSKGKMAAGHGETEEPNARGAMAQGMRMGEMVVAGAFRERSEIMSAYQYLMGNVQQENENLRKRAFDAEELALQLIRERAVADHDHRMTELKYERGTMLQQKIVTLLPALIRTITGNNDIIPESTADTAILESVALAIRKMPKDQQLDTMTKIVGVSPELAQVLGPRLQEIAARQEAEEIAAKELAKEKSAERVAEDAAHAAMLLGMKPAAPALGK